MNRRLKAKATRTNVSSIHRARYFTFYSRLAFALPLIFYHLSLCTNPFYVDATINEQTYAKDNHPIRGRISPYANHVVHQPNSSGEK